MTTPENAADDSPFWRFSLRFYSLPDVAPACLMLQDEAGADVNLMLLLLFLAQSHRLVTSEDIARLDRMIRAWREEAVKPLRGLRRRLKQGIDSLPSAISEAFRNKIKQVELEAERIEQHWLEREAERRAFVTAPSRAEAARANLMAYGAYLGRFPKEPLKIVLDAFTDRPL
jgi:uncharacterized protein (TIGR02444 family)